ncbi:MAG TPA: hypothetical protein VFJ98_10120 [Mycobacteriales bacterium]|nr:hypothetical protein [Mycobacteriales bacterium]
MFDAYQVQRALRGHLAEDDVMENLARDEATGAFWVLTRRELLIVKDLQIVDRLDRTAVAGEVSTSDVGVTVRVRGSDRAKVLVGTFRKACRLTDALTELVQDHPR